MNVIRKNPPLLVSEDFSSGPGASIRARSVRSCANKLATLLDSTIEIVHVTDDHLYSSGSAKWKTHISQYLKKQKLELAKLAKWFSVPAKPRLMGGDPVKEILSLISKPSAYEMVILGTQGRRGLKRIFLGSVAEEVVRHSLVPVMTLGPEAQKGSTPFLKSPIKIFIPTVLSSNSDLAEKYALHLATRLGAEVIFFHSLHEALHPVLQTAFSVPRPSPAIRKFFEESVAASEKLLMSRVRKAETKGISASYILDKRSLSSSNAILKATVHSEASLVIMGTHGRSMLKGAFFGRTARDLIIASSVPVITVRSLKK